MGSKEHTDVRARTKSGRTQRGVKGEVLSRVPDPRDCQCRTSPTLSARCSALTTHIGPRQGCLPPYMSPEAGTGAGRIIHSCGYWVPGTCCVVCPKTIPVPWHDCASLWWGAGPSECV